jgi:hypothetical protein
MVLRKSENYLAKIKYQSWKNQVSEFLNQSAYMG